MTRPCAARSRAAAEGWRTTLDKLEQEVARIKADGNAAPSATRSFTIERIFAASPAAVFHALSDTAAKARWFDGGDGYVRRSSATWMCAPAGASAQGGAGGSGMVTTFDARLFRRRADERLVYAYEMHLDERKISVSLATLAAGSGGNGNAAHRDGAGDVPGRLRRRGIAREGHGVPAGPAGRDACGVSVGFGHRRLSSWLVWPRKQAAAANLITQSKAACPPRAALARTPPTPAARPGRRTAGRRSANPPAGRPR